MRIDPHNRSFSLHPLFQLALAYAAGVLATHFFSGPLWAPITLCGVSSLNVLLFFKKGRWRLAGVFLLLSFFFAGGSLFLLEKRTRPANNLAQLLDSGCIDDEENAEITGLLQEPPEFARGRIYFVLRVEELVTQAFSGRVAGTVSLLAVVKTATAQDEYQSLKLHYGARVRIRTTLNRTNQFRNPGVSSFTDYLDQKGYDAAGLIKSPTSVVKLQDNNTFSPRATLYRWRETFQEAIDQRFSTETAGVLDAALLGNRHNLSQSTIERFREGGTFHVLVISGLHISFVGGLVLLLARRFSDRRLFQFIASSGFVWAYSIAVGGQASVIRAALMFTVVSFGILLFRSASALNALGAAGLILLVNNPRDLFDPSLQLTFLSVLAIVTIAWPLLQTFKAIGSWRPIRSSPYPPSCSSLLRMICEALYWSETEWQGELERSTYSCRLFKSPIASWLERKSLQGLLRYMSGAVVVSISVQLVLLPLLIIYFHRVSISSLVLNVFVGFLLAALGITALFAILISLVSVTLASPLLHLANLINWVMVRSVEPFSFFGLSNIRLPEYTGWSASIYVLYCLPLIVLLMGLARWRPLTAPALSQTQVSYSVWFAALFQSVLVAVLLFHPRSAWQPDGRLHVDFLDVGQGDAALVTMPDGTLLLVDGGGRPSFWSTTSESSSQSSEPETRSIGEIVVAEYLWWRGLDRVDYVLATHADADHIDGLNDVIRNFSIRSALVARMPDNDPEYVKFAQTLTETNTQVERIEAGDRLQFGNVSATVLWPHPPGETNASSANNDSVVLLLKFDNTSILLTGDIEKEAERKIVAANSNLHADVIKVPHHGSHTSSTDALVKATSPAFAIISVGQRSMFGHPHKDVVARWSASGAEVLTTGRCGMISVSSDGKTVTIKKFVK